MSTLETAHSWVIVSLATGEAVLETYSEKLAQAINTSKYKAVPVYEWLASINQQSRG